MFRATRITIQHTELIDAKDQHVTQPACQQLCVRWWQGCSRSSYADMKLHVEDEIKIADMLTFGERIDDLKEKYGEMCGYPSNPVRHPDVFEILFFEDVSIPSWHDELRALKGWMSKEEMKVGRKSKRAPVFLLKRAAIKTDYKRQ